MCQLALNSLKNQKKEKSISDLLVMALPERVVAGLSRAVARKKNMTEAMSVVKLYSEVFKCL